MMENHGQIYATDDDGRRLTPIFDRLARAVVRNVQVRAPRGERDILSDLAGRCDVVLIDAPCTGSGAWRRNPDAKWRVRPGALEQRIKDQNETLERAAGYVKPGGHLVYVTCSLLKAENEDRIAAFLAAHDGVPAARGGALGFGLRPAGARGAGLDARRRLPLQPLAHRDGRVLCRAADPLGVRRRRARRRRTRCTARWDPEHAIWRLPRADRHRRPRRLDRRHDPRIRHGVLTNIIVGVAGAWIGSELADLAHVAVRGTLEHFVAALVGSAALLYIWQLINKRG